MTIKAASLIVAVCIHPKYATKHKNMKDYSKGHVCILTIVLPVMIANRKGDRFARFCGYKGRALKIVNLFPSGHP